MGKLICFLCCSCFPEPTLSVFQLVWSAAQADSAIPCLLISEEGWTVCSLFSRLPVMFSWCFLIRSKMERTGTSSAAALLIQHSLSTRLTSGNRLAFLTVATLTRSLCNSSEECLFQDGTAETAPLKTRLKAEWCAIKLSYSQYTHQREQLEQQGDSVVKA